MKLTCSGCGVVMQVTGGGMALCGCGHSTAVLPSFVEIPKMAVEAESPPPMEDLVVAYERSGERGWYLMDGDERVRKLSKAEAMEIRDA